MKKNRLLMMIMVVTTTAFLLACGGSGDNGNSSSIPDVPGKVLLITITVGGDSILFDWTDPSESGFDHIEITCDGSTDTVGKGIETHEITGLEVATLYNVTVEAANSTGDLFEAVTFTMETESEAGDSVEYLVINTVDDLNAVRGGVTGYGGWSLDRNYILMADIDLSTSDYRTGWTPLGQPGSPFTGKFLGNGHVISKLIINAKSSDFQGLFGYIEDGYVQDLGLTDVVIRGHNYLGGLVGYIIKSSPRKTVGISNCYTTGRVAGGGGTVKVGGLVGVSDDPQVIISDSYSNVNLFGDTKVGGLVGYNKGKISNSYATGYTKGIYQTGGLVGYNEGVISNSYATGTLGAGRMTGGLVGYNEGGISACYASGEVYASWFQFVGGLVGAQGGWISNSYSTGNVSGGSDVAGLVGHSNSTATISNSYATGHVTTVGNNVTGGKSAGGLAIAIGTIYNSFYDSVTIGAADTGGGTLKTTSEMTDVSTFTDTSTNGLDAPWDFVDNPNDDNATADIWSIDSDDIDPLINGGYPYLTDLANTH